MHAPSSFPSGEETRWGMWAFRGSVQGAATRAGAGLAGRGGLRVTIALAGTGMAPRAEMRERFALEEEITRRRIGAITDGGSGEGVMWIEIAAGDGEAAEHESREAIEAAGLAGRARIVVSS